MTRNLISVLALVFAVTSCTDSDNAGDFATLYDSPHGTSTTSLYGTWGGAADGNDTRWVLEPDRLTLANRCNASNTIVGVVVAAEIDDNRIRIIESKNSTQGSCFVKSTPGTITACTGNPMLNCFVHNGKDLTLYADPINLIKLTKIVD